MRDYELMYIVRPELDEDGIQAAAGSVQSLIEAQGGEVLDTTMWGRRRLAYEVDHLRDGHYVILGVRLDGGRVAPLERALRIHDQVFRHLLVVRDGTAPAAAVLTAPPVTLPEPSGRSRDLPGEDDEEGEEGLDPDADELDEGESERETERERDGAAGVR